MSGESRFGSARGRIAGWAGVTISTLLATLWSLWGIFENFHEGWYHRELWPNVQLMFDQYLSVPLCIMLGSAVAITRPRLGALAYLLFAAFAAWEFHSAPGQAWLFFIAAPLLALALLSWCADVRPRRVALWIALGLPLVTMTVAAAPNAWRVAHRVDDGSREARLIVGNEVELVWAPAGPGWPEDGLSWEQALDRCRRLSADGRTLADQPLDIWRLPTVEELIASSVRHGQNAGGRWNDRAQRATFQVTPDKEAPLWDPHSKVIYWWTSSETADGKALRVAFNGHVMPVPKHVGWGYLGFRAVRSTAIAKP